MPSFREVRNHRLDLFIDMKPQFVFPIVVMGKPCDRPEVPVIFVRSLQVAPPRIHHQPLVEVLEHRDIPSTGNLHQDGVAR